MISKSFQQLLTDYQHIDHGFYKLAGCERIDDFDQDIFDDHGLNDEDVIVFNSRENGGLIAMEADSHDIFELEVSEEHDWWEFYGYGSKMSKDVSTKTLWERYDYLSDLFNPDREFHSLGFDDEQTLLQAFESDKKSISSDDHNAVYWLLVSRLLGFKLHYMELRKLCESRETVKDACAFLNLENAFADLYKAKNLIFPEHKAFFKTEFLNRLHRLQDVQG